MLEGLNGERLARIGSTSLLLTRRIVRRIIYGQHPAFGIVNDHFDVDQNKLGLPEGS